MVVRARTKRYRLVLTRIALLASAVCLGVFLCLVQEGFLLHSSSSEFATPPLDPMMRMLHADGKKMYRTEKHMGIVRQRGKNWTLWDRNSVLHGDLNLTCEWTQYRPAHATGAVQAAPMCVYPLNRDRSVSKSIVKKGRWPDCDGLTPILQNSSSSKKTKNIHVEIGANIGSCVMQVLLTTDAEVFAFEPHPYNLFLLTSTLMSLHETYRNRVHLFPIGLGAKKRFSKVVANRKNMGNAQVLRNAKRGRGGFVIRIERLDDLLDMSKHPVALMKMDAQGYECRVLDGMEKTLLFTKNLVFEVENDQFTRFDDCSPSLVVNRVKESGFTLHRFQIEGKDYDAKADLPDFNKFEGQDAVDLVATRD